MQSLAVLMYKTLLPPEDLSITIPHRFGFDKSQYPLQGSQYL